MKTVILSTLVVATLSMSAFASSNHHNSSASNRNYNTNISNPSANASNRSYNTNRNNNSARSSANNSTRVSNNSKSKSSANNTNRVNNNTNVRNSNRVNTTDVNNVRNSNKQGQSQGQKQSTKSRSGSSSDNAVTIQGDTIKYDVAASSVPSSMATQCGSSAAAQTEKGGVSTSASDTICDNLMAANVTWERSIALKSIDPELASEFMELSNDHVMSVSHAARASKPAGIIERVFSPVIKLATGIAGLIGLGV